MASDFKAYASRFHGWILQQIEVAGGVRQLHSAFAVLADKINEEPLSPTTFYDWQAGKLKRELNQRSIRLVAAWRNETEKQVTDWLTGVEEPTSSPKSLIDLESLRQTIATLNSRAELIRILAVVVSQLEQLEYSDTDGGTIVRRFQSIAEFLDDAFAKRGYSRAEGLAMLKVWYERDYPDAGDSDRFDGYLNGTVSFDLADPGLCLQLAGLLSKLTGLTYQMNDVAALRCPVCSDNAAVNGHHIERV